VPEAPNLPGLAFRHFRGEGDYPGMAAVITGSKEADGIEWSQSLEDMARTYRHLVNSDPYEDILIATMNGDTIGYTRVWWDEERDGTRIYQHFAHLLPIWREKGVRRAMVAHNERRLGEIATGHPGCVERFFQASAGEKETNLTSVLLDMGYDPVRYEYGLVRPDLEDIPDLPLPDGLEVRPVKPEHYRLIWKALDEAFRDHWGSMEWREEWLEEWMESPTFDPSIWQVAWDGEQVAGNVLTFINEAENEEYNRKRGYTEYISVRRPWRRRGLARALIARSLRTQKERGMTESALGVDSQNPTGAFKLYQSMGFVVDREFVLYRKPLATG
jgi:GNAT superfamily N-acetyltransferase